MVRASPQKEKFYEKVGSRNRAIHQGRTHLQGQNQNIDATVTLQPNDDKAKDSHPDYIVLHGQNEIGVAWNQEDDRRILHLSGVRGRVGPVHNGIVGITGQCPETKRWVVRSGRVWPRIGASATNLHAS
jgi:hypothetical protein